MKLAGKTAFVALDATNATVAAALRRAGARVETEGTLAAAAEKFGGIDIVHTEAGLVHDALPHLRDNGTVIVHGRPVAHPPKALLEPRRLRVNYVVADASTPPHEIAETVLHLASDDAFTTQGEVVVLTHLALAS